MWPFPTVDDTLVMYLGRRKNFPKPEITRFFQWPRLRCFTSWVLFTPQLGLLI